MGFHTFDVSRAERLEDPERYRYCSRDELIELLDPSDATCIVDLGSGTGFYTDDIATVVSEVYAVDVQGGMHAFYRQKGVPSGVELLTADISSLPVTEGSLDAAISTMTFHEFADPDTLSEVRRALVEGGACVVVDWTADGRGETGPPLDERYALSEALELLRSVGFRIEHSADRTETFLIRATT